MSDRKLPRSYEAGDWIDLERFNRLRNAAVMGSRPTGGGDIMVSDGPLGGVLIEMPEPAHIGIFPIFVTLERDSGGAGSKTTPCTFTYEATDLFGNTLGANLTPQHQRTSVGLHLEATIGLGYQKLAEVDPVGNTSFTLWWTDEKLNLLAC